MCTLSRRNVHSGIGENGLQPIDPSAAGWDEMRHQVSLSALRNRDGVAANFVARPAGRGGVANDETRRVHGQGRAFRSASGGHAS